MKIIQLIYSLSSGGAERLVIDLSNELTNEGNEVHLVVFLNNHKNGKDLHFYKFLLSDKVYYHNLNIKEGFRLSAFTSVIGCIRNLKPDVVHCHLNVIPYIFPLALFSKKIKFYHTLHNVAHRTVGSWLQKNMNRYFYKKKKIVPIAISELCNQSYQKFYGLNNAVTIENGRSVVEPTDDYQKTKKEIETLTSNSVKPVFVHVARYAKLKNQALLINAFNKIENEGIDFTLLIIGSGFETQDGIALQRKACNSIKFLGEKKNVNDYLLCADSFCLSSEYEGFPISLLEALSAGCVPICTPVGGIPDVITEGITGYLSDDVSLESYCKAINRYLSNLKAIEKKTLIDHFKTNYSIEICAQKHISLYKQK